MTTSEVWWLIEAHTKPAYAGGMTEAECAELYEENWPDG